MSENDGAQLAPLSAERIADIEKAVFGEIAAEAPAHRVGGARNRSPRRHRWAVGLGVAAAFVGGVLIAPPLLSAVTHQVAFSESSTMEAAGGSVSAESAPIPAVGQPLTGNQPRDTAASDGTDADAENARDIVTTAQITLRVSDIVRAADALSALATKHDGYIESSSIGADAESASDARDAATKPAPSERDGWVSIRVPAADLTEVMSAIGDEGQVLGSSISRDDVTAAAVDLRARVAASKASVERLTELMSKSGSVSDLIAAESALSERQAQLESYQQQLKSIDEQVSMSTVQVQLTKRVQATQADPAGFGDGLLAGWNGLIVALNALVVAVGFLLPWLAIAGAVLLIVWLIRRTRRSHTRRNP